MKVFVDTKFGLTLSFELDRENRVFDIKKVIEESQGIPVSMQTLFFNGSELLIGHYQLRAYRIVDGSRLLLLLRDDHVNNQMHHQGFVPFPSMARSNYEQVPQSHTRSESFFNQDLSMMPRSNDYQDQDGLVSNEESVLETFSMNEYLARDPEPWTDQDTRKMQGFWPGTDKESLGRNNKNQDLLQSPTSIINMNQVSPPPQKLKVIMRQCYKPYKKFLVDANASNNVEELKKEMEKIQFDLPAKGYFFMHKDKVLEEDKSFYWNRVAHGDTIEIVPGPLIGDDQKVGV